MIILRRVLTGLAVATGLLAATAGPAAGIALGNHCPPPAAR